MEDKVSKTYDEIKRLTEKVESMERKIDTIVQELRVSESGDLGTQVRNVEAKVKGMETKLNEVSFKIDLLKKTCETLDVYTREIQKAIAMIYRNTDELEQNIVEGERQT